MARADATSDQSRKKPLEAALKAIAAKDTELEGARALSSRAVELEHELAAARTELSLAKSANPTTAESERIRDLEEKVEMLLARSSAVAAAAPPPPTPPAPPRAPAIAPTSREIALPRGGCERVVAEKLLASHTSSPQSFVTELDLAREIGRAGFSSKPSAVIGNLRTRHGWTIESASDAAPRAGLAKGWRVRP